MIKTKITEMFDIEHPMVQGGMIYRRLAGIAPAVSTAGGLALIIEHTHARPTDLAIELSRYIEISNNQSGVNLTFLPGFAYPDYPFYK